MRFKLLGKVPMARRTTPHSDKNTQQKVWQSKFRGESTASLHSVIKGKREKIPEWFFSDFVAWKVGRYRHC